MKFKLIRFHPQKIEIEVLPAQIVSMFPIELQDHPTFGVIKRVWKFNQTEYDTNAFEKCEIENLSSSSRTFIKVKEEAMMKLLQEVQEFQIVLYYQDKKDVYLVSKL